MIILITNSALTVGGGTQTVVVELCRLLRRRGHQVMIFSSHLGHVAELLRAEKFPVVGNLRNLPHKPDIIHGQHHLETMSALLALPETPVLYYIHGLIPWEERVPVHPRILAYINLAETSAFRTSVEKSIPAARFHVIENSVNLSWFPSPKSPPLHLRTAAYCPRTHPKPDTLAHLQTLCRELDILLVHESGWADGTVADPGAVYARYDLIFGTGRTALEALAAGCVVSLCDADRLGPVITSGNIADRRKTNLALAIWEDGTPAAELSRQLAAYDPAEQQQVVDFIRSDADLEKATDRLVDIYRDVISEWQNPPRSNPADDMAASSNYLRSLIPLFSAHETVEKEVQENVRLRTDMENGRLKAESSLRKLRVKIESQQQEIAELKAIIERNELSGKQRQKIAALLQNFTVRHPLRRHFLGSLIQKIEKVLEK